MFSPFTGLWVLGVPSSFRIVGAGFVTLVQDYGCWMCHPYSELWVLDLSPFHRIMCALNALPCTGSWVLDVHPFHRIVSAGFVTLVQDPGCWMCPPRSGSWVLAVPPCRVLQVPSATHGALWWVLSATHPGVLAVLPAQHPSAGCAPGRVVGVGTTHLARRVPGGAGWPPRRGLWVLWDTPGVTGGSGPTSASALGIPGHPWVPAAAVRGRERCLPGKTKNIPVQGPASPPRPWFPSPSAMGISRCPPWLFIPIPGRSGMGPWLGWCWRTESSLVTAAHQSQRPELGTAPKSQMWLLRAAKVWL